MPAGPGPHRETMSIPPTDARPQAVLLDAAGTLIRPARPVGETYAAVAAEHGAELAPGRLAHAFREVFPQMPAMAFPPVEPAELDLLERGWWRRLVREVLARCEATVEPFDPFFDALYGRFAHAEAWRTFSEVEAALGRLRGAGLRLAIVSNFDSRLEGIAAGLGLLDRVDALVYSTRCGSAKPDRRIFDEALARLEVPAGRAAHVGDSRTADYHGALGAGVQPWLLARDGDRPPGTATVRDLEELASRILDSPG